MSSLFLVELDGMQQSAVDLADPARLIFDYARRVGDVIDAMPAGPLRVLHIGGAAMTLPRYVDHMRPRSLQVVLEPAIDVIDHVLEEAPLPPGIRIDIRPVTGQVGIKELRTASQDVVILDAFEDGVVPPELTSAAFVAEVRRVLAPGGVFVTNLIDCPPYPRVRPFVETARNFGGLLIVVEPATMKGRREGNMVIVCGAVPPGAFDDSGEAGYRVFRGAEVADAFSVR